MRTVADPPLETAVESGQEALTTEPPLNLKSRSHRAACQWPASLSLGSQSFGRQTCRLAELSFHGSNVLKNEKLSSVPFVLRKSSVPLLISVI